MRKKIGAGFSVFMYRLLSWVTDFGGSDLCDATDCKFEIAAPLLWDDPEPFASSDLCDATDCFGETLRLNHCGPMQ